MTEFRSRKDGSHYPISSNKGDSRMPKMATYSIDQEQLKEARRRQREEERRRRKAEEEQEVQEEE